MKLWGRRLRHHRSIGEKKHMKKDNKLYYIVAIAIVIVIAVVKLVTGKTDSKNTATETVISETEEAENARAEAEDAKEAKAETAETETKEAKAETEAYETSPIDEDGSYTGKEEVALYIHTYGHLPSNFITKDEAELLGWESSEGNLDEVAPGKSIGGDRFGNYEELLPDENGRKYYECDINYDGGYRGSERIIYSNDGLIYYTNDHYETFEMLYDGD